MAEPQEKGISRAALMVVITAGLASLLEIVDTSIVNVAIPTMMGNLGATLDEIGWVVTGYIISNAIILPISGWLATRFGRRHYYITCILMFIVASVACGMAPNLWTLVVFRVVQGAAGGALLPTSQALIQEVFPGKRSGLGSALYGMVVIIGPTIGPPLGGYLTDHFGWRMIFNINLPLGILAAFLASLYVTDYPEEGEHAAARQATRNAPVDTLGLTFLIVGVGCLQYILERGQADDWFSSHLILAFTVTAAFCIPAFVWWELRTEHPIMDLRLYKSVALINGTIMMACVGGMLYGLIFFIPIFASTILNMNASQTGNLFTPGAIAAGVMMPIIGSQLQKRDPRLFMFWGICCVDSALFMLAHFTPQSTYWTLFWPLLIRGLGMAAVFIPVNAMVLGGFSGPALGQAAGMLNLSRQLGGSLGIAILSTMFNKSTDAAYDHLRQYISPLSMGFSQWAQSAKGIAFRFSDGLGMYNMDSLVIKEAYFRVKKQAFVMAFDQMGWVMVIGFALAGIPIFFMKKPQKMGSAADAH
ncbi:MAG TPA: DHA2 family efflux MFS transporter permease subunit [bacterium]|nr:DHA2 family efflux MFS transporter permease subunit [bacterium]